MLVNRPVGVSLCVFVRWHCLSPRALTPSDLPGWRGPTRAFSTKRPSQLSPEHTHTHSHSDLEGPEEPGVPVGGGAHTHGHSHGLLGHSHSHAHSLTGELLSTGKLQDPAVRITLVGFLTNVGMAAGKAVGGVVFNSQSLIADSIHALSDLISDVLTLATVSVAKRPPDSAFPHGYGRIEAMGAFGVSSLLLTAGLSMGYGSLVEVLHAFGVTLPVLGGLAHSHATPAEWSAAYIAVASIGIKEALYQATRKVAEQQNSPVLLANAWHHRVDCLVSAVAVASISLGQVMQASWVDPLGGLLVSGLIVRAGYRPAVDAVFELSGSLSTARTSPKSQEFADTVGAAVRRLAPNYTVKSCLLEPYGSTFVGTVQLENVDGNVEFVAAQLRDELMQIEHIRQINITV